MIRSARGFAFAALVAACTPGAGSAPVATSRPAEAARTPGAIAEPARVLDAFEDTTAWRASGSDGVTAAIHAVPGVTGRALRLALDFGGTSGYAVARRALPLTLPDDFELTFSLRGDIPVNNLELKLVDESGDNVWWFHRPSFAFPPAWRAMSVKRRQITFAWGPTADRTLRRIAAIELVVATGQGPESGGKGWVEIDELVLRPRAAEPGPAPAAQATASSALPGATAALAIDGATATAWASDPASGPAQQLTIDLGRERDLGGVIVRWVERGHATDYQVAVSRDGAAWHTAAAIAGGDGGLDPIPLAETTARFVRLALTRADRRGASAGYQLAELTVVDAADAETPNAFVARLADQVPRGSLPRGMSGEQPYWTVVGIDGFGRNSLMSEDGAVELAGGATLEPFVEVAGALASWATVDIAQSLVDRYLPIPRVTWRAPGWQLEITALGLGDRSRPQVAVRYTLHNPGATPLTARLVLAVRPFQVTPPTQFLNLAGGVRRIERIAWDGRSLTVDAAPPLHPLTRPDQVALRQLHAGGFSIGETGSGWLGPSPGAGTSSGAPAPGSAAPAAIVDPAGLASGALIYQLTVPPGGETSVVATGALADVAPALPSPAAAASWFDAQLAALRAAWHARLDRVGFRVPPAGEPIIDTLRSSLAYMLLSRDGPILRPGTRSYARAWIRDGAMIGEALLRLGHGDIAEDFLRWYAPYQFASGKVPCCVERHGAVPVPEHDSHGQLIYLAAELYRYRRDRALITALWPRLTAAARYMDELRQAERTPANQTPERRARYGLLPPSISHEGYSAKPAYSYWDDFWGLAGLRDAAWLAGELGDTAAAGQLAAQRDEFQHDLLASITAAAATHRIGFIPGAADLGDFDATSTTIALSPGGVQHLLPADLLHATFERAWQALVARGSAPATADAAYTPYELRLIGSFLRLGWRDRAHDGLARYLADRRPAAWNQWAEVVGLDPRAPRFIGDMPHAWVHSDYARSVLDGFAYLREHDSALVLAAGIPAGWFADGFAVDGLPTPYGPLSYAVTAAPRTVTVRVGPGSVPPGGLVLPWPWRERPGPARIDGAAARWRGTELVLSARPATITLTRPGVATQP